MEEELKSFLEQSSGQYLLGKDAKITEDTTLIWLYNCVKKSIDEHWGFKD